MAGSYYEAIIIGAGVAGASLAHALADRGVGPILVLEREPRPATQASGRSAQTLLEFDLDPLIQRLKIAGASWLRRPAAGFSRHELFFRAGALRLCSETEWAGLEKQAPALRAAGLQVDPIGEEETRRRVPALAAGQCAGAAWLPESGFIDVPALIEAYISQAVRAGAVFRFGAPVSAIHSAAGRADAVVVFGETFRGRVIVNAAGAWAGPIAHMAGALPIELTPYRRSIATYPGPPRFDLRSWPLVWSDAHRIYFRPGFDGLMVCPMDEEPSDPGEPSVDPRVLAAGFERLRLLAPDLVPAAATRSWAGLRTFAPDRRPVVGEDPVRPGFFWLAGQGGSGIETSRVLAQLASDLIVGGATSGVDPSPLAAARFAERAAFP